MDAVRKTNTATLLFIPEKKMTGKMKHTNPMKTCQNEYDCSMDQIITVLNRSAVINPARNFINLWLYF
jgi:hypothetical protein